MQFAFGVGQVLLCELTSNSIEDRYEAFALVRQAPVKCTSMQTEMLGDPIQRADSARQQHPDDLANLLWQIVAEVGQLRIQPSFDFTHQHRVGCRNWHFQIAAVADQP